VASIWGNQLMSAPLAKEVVSVVITGGFICGISPLQDEVRLIKASETIKMNDFLGQGDIIR
ncbi:MAG TPA: hypothetical protein VI413_09130, partial [Paludibacter sp.]